MGWGGGGTRARTHTYTSPSLPLTSWRPSLYRQYVWKKSTKRFYCFDQRITMIVIDIGCYFNKWIKCFFQWLIEVDMSAVHWDRYLSGLVRCLFSVGGRWQWVSYVTEYIGCVSNWVKWLFEWLSEVTISVSERAESLSKVNIGVT